jgi:hypothetical protein
MALPHRDRRAEDPETTRRRVGAVGTYHLVSEWRVEAPVERVWEALADYAAWPAWWRGIRGVEELRKGDERGVGTVLRQRWRSLLPYTLVFDLEMTRIEPNARLEGRASGDLAGTCAWSMATDTDATTMQFAADVRTVRWWMNVPVPFAAPIFSANFETIMRWGRRGLARRLGSPVTPARGARRATA